MNISGSSHETTRKTSGLFHFFSCPLMRKIASGIRLFVLMTLRLHTQRLSRHLHRQIAPNGMKQSHVRRADGAHRKATDQYHLIARPHHVGLLQGKSTWSSISSSEF